MNLTELLTLQWNNDERMVKYCLKSTKYVQLGDKFVAVTSSKPTIDKTMWYDDETKGPEVSFESFRRYNESNMPHELVKEKSLWGGLSKLYIVPNYYRDKTDGRLAGITYEPSERAPANGREVTDAELEAFNMAIRDVQADYEKRLAAYWKRYSHKVTAQGYWANR